MAVLLKVYMREVSDLKKKKNSIIPHIVFKLTPNNSFFEKVFTLHPNDEMSV